MSSHFFSYRDGRLHASDIALDALAAEVGTPFYCYSADALEHGYRFFAEALKGLPATICYALKANSNQAVIRTFAALGAGADVVSEGELRRALAAGVPAEKIVFAGVGKTARELAAGLDAGIMQFNVESLSELKLLSQVASQRGATAPVALRVNPDVDAGTHEKITTGRADSKFGIDAAAAGKRAADLIARLGLEAQAHERCQGFSKGMRQKVALAGALVHDPRLLILDEPLTGLDASAARQAKDVLAERVRDGVTVIMTTHILEVAERMAERIGVIDRGRLIAEGSLDELRAQLGHDGTSLEDVFLDLVARQSDAA